MRLLPIFAFSLADVMYHAKILWCLQNSTICGGTDTLISPLFANNITGTGLPLGNVALSLKSRSH